MRIVDEWNHGPVKLTVFHMNGRYSIKLEKDLLEQTYKFRDGRFSSTEDLKKGLTDAFYSECLGIFNKMADARHRIAEKPDDEAQFDDII